jgi:hypothetical protein
LSSSTHGVASVNKNHRTSTRLTCRERRVLATQSAVLGLLFSIAPVPHSTSQTFYRLGPLFA